MALLNNDETNKILTYQSEKQMSKDTGSDTAYVSLAKLTKETPGDIINKLPFFNGLMKLSTLASLVAIIVLFLNLLGVTHIHVLPVIALMFTPVYVFLVFAAIAVLLVLGMDIQLRHEKNRSMVQNESK